MKISEQAAEENKKEHAAQMVALARKILSEKESRNRRGVELDRALLLLDEGKLEEAYTLVNSQGGRAYTY